MDYVWIRLDQKGPDNNLCAKRICLRKSVTLHLVAAVTLHSEESWLFAEREESPCDVDGDARNAPTPVPDDLHQETDLNVGVAQ